LKKQEVKSLGQKVTLPIKGEIGGMKMMEIGRICLKLAGRDAGRKCVIVDVLEGNYTLIDGNVRRRKCNILHLEATSQKIDIKKGASHEDVKKEFSKLKLDVWETKAKEKKERPRKIRKKKIKEGVAVEGKIEKKKEGKAKDVKKEKNVEKPAVKDSKITKKVEKK